MKMKIFNETTPQPIDETYFRLVQSPHGSETIRLIAVDPVTGEQRSCGRILDFNSKGKVTLHGAIAIPGLPQRFTLSDN